jgi:hypothetical protein
MELSGAFGFDRTGRQGFPVVKAEAKPTSQKPYPASVALMFGLPAMTLSTGVDVTETEFCMGLYGWPPLYW